MSDDSAATAKPAAPPMEQPVQTVYCSHLPDRLSRDKLRRQLFNLFSRFGAVLDVAVKKTKHTRGQAWVVFSTVDAASKAIAALQGYPFFDKDMRLNFARGNADVVAKLNGTFVQRQKRERPVAAARAAAADPATKKQRVDEEEEEAQEEDADVDAANPPGQVLKADRLPAWVDAPALQHVFAGMRGFKEVRLAQGKGVAFIEFASVELASAAREAAKGQQIASPSSSSEQQHRLRVNFAKQ